MTYLPRPISHATSNLAADIVGGSPFAIYLCRYVEGGLERTAFYVGERAAIYRYLARMGDGSVANWRRCRSIGMMYVRKNISFIN